MFSRPLRALRALSLTSILRTRARWSRGGTGRGTNGAQTPGYKDGEIYVLVICRREAVVFRFKFVHPGVPVPMVPASKSCAAAPSVLSASAPPEN